MEQKRIRSIPRPIPLSQRAAEILRDGILSGAYASGERLVEARIAREMNISRGPLREALKELRAEGLVQEEPGRGAFVVALRHEDIRELYELRAAIEGRAARLLIQRKDPAAFAKLEDVLRKMGEAAKAKDAEGVAKLDSTFHQELCRLSGNSRLYRIYLSQSAMVRPLLKLDNERFYDDLGDSWKEHRALLSAIKKGDIRHAEDLYSQHLDKAKERILDFLGSESDT